MHGNSLCMYGKSLQIFLSHILVVALAFEDLFFVSAQVNQEMVEHGRKQYQLLKEKSTLPQYGSCWKAAVEHLDEGCRYLSEDTQSDIALHITNCFLEMSGHETYNCELDKKPNLRAICINNMSDRAFNVYTEFYTHTQNICWFLRGQIWHETIVENTVKVGRQLEETAQNQESLLQAQKESLELQEKMLNHGKILEKVLEDLYVASKTHQEILSVMTQSVSNLQAWIVGEISWIDSIIFYGTTILLTLFITSSKRTASARLPVFLLLFLNFIVERLICSSILSKGDNIETQNVYNDIYDSVWYSRYAFVSLSACILIYQALIHKDLILKNYEIVNNIQKQNNDILNNLQCLKNVLIPSKEQINMMNESLSKKSSDGDVNSVDNESTDNSSYKSKYSVYKRNSYSPILNMFKDFKERSNESTKENYCNNSKDSSATRKRLLPLNELQNSRYNLRSKQGTPEYE